MKINGRLIYEDNVGIKIVLLVLQDGHRNIMMTSFKFLLMHGEDLR